MARTETSDVGDVEDTEPPSANVAELHTQIDVLETENERLRSEYVRARQSSYRRTALALGALGGASVLAAVLFTSVRDVLLSLGAIGLFGAVLTYYLTPERFIAADVGERVYSALAANESALVSELGLADSRVYVPVDDPDARVRLYVPHRASDHLPEDLSSLFVVNDEGRGVALDPSGAPLFEEFERTLSGSLADAPAELTTQLSDAVGDAFEIVDAVQTDVDSAGGRASVHVSDPAYPDANAFDNPIASFIAVGYAVGLDTPVTVEVSESDSDDGFSITCRWDAGAETERDNS